MGFGYTYFFYFTKFVLLLGLFPLAVYGITMIIRNSRGRDCLPEGVLSKITGKGLDALPALKQHFGWTPVIGKVEEYLSSLHRHTRLIKYMNLNCLYD